MIDKQQILKQLDAIKPGKNYPGSVYIVEEVPEHGTVKLKFCLQSYFVGMYCAIRFNDEMIPTQAGDHNNKSFVTRLKKDIMKALNRGAEIEIGPLSPVKTFVNEAKAKAA